MCTGVKLQSLALAVSVLACGCGRPKVDEVVIYVAVDRKDAEPILKAFERQSGVRVRAMYDAEAAKTTGLVTRLLAESNHPRCDVFWNNEIVNTLLLAERGLLAPYHSPAAADIPEDDKAPDGLWTAVATRARVIVYNTQHVSAEDAPRRLAELIEPRWRGKLAVADPQFGTTRTHVAAMFAAWGPERAERYLQALLDNQVRIVDGNAMVKNLVAQAQPGASPIYVGLTDTDDVLSGQAEEQPIEMILPDQDSDGTLIIPSTVCILKGSPNPEMARRLTDYLLAPATGARFTAPGTGYSPIREPASDQETTSGDVRAMDVPYQAVLQQLAPSSQWTASNFHP